MSEDYDRERFREQRPQRSREERPPRRAGNADFGDTPPRTGGGGGKIIVIVLSVLALFGFCVLGSCGLLGFVLYREGQKGSERAMVNNNFRQIGMGMHEYQNAYGTFPPASFKTRSGKPGLSWRVAILPYVEQGDLYKKFRTDEPWDHPDNLALASNMPAIYAPRRNAGGDRTHVRIFVGQGTIFNLRNNTALSSTGITDGNLNTFLIVESTDSVQWTRPDELEFQPKESLPSLGLPENDFFRVVFADGSIRQVRKSMSPEKIKAAITPNGGEVVVFDY